MGRPIDMAYKVCELSIPNHDIDLCVSMVGGWMYQIVIRVTSDIGMPLTYVVC